MVFPRTVTAILLAATAALAGGENLTAPAVATGRLDARLEWGAFDRRLAADAIFAETNRVRRLLGLPEFEPSAAADQAAEIQASTNAMLGRIAHDNPLAGLATALDRAERAGIRAESVGENLALSSVLNWRGTSPAYRDEPGGTRRIVDLNTGGDIPNHTYASFAEDVVRQWMESPGHRANIVNPHFTQLGCAVWPTRGASRAELLVSAQLFVRPLRVRQRPKP